MIRLVESWRIERSLSAFRAMIKPWKIFDFIENELIIVSISFFGREKKIGEVSALSMLRGEGRAIFISFHNCFADRFSKVSS